jgi:hypothetical protein
MSPYRSCWHRQGTNNFLISGWVFQKIENDNNAIKRVRCHTDQWKYCHVKISWHCPFKDKVILVSKTYVSSMSWNPGIPGMCGSSEVCCHSPPLQIFIAAKRKWEGEGAEWGKHVKRTQHGISGRIVRITLIIHGNCALTPLSLSGRTWRDSIPMCQRYSVKERRRLVLRESHPK